MRLLCDWKVSTSTSLLDEAVEEHQEVKNSGLAGRRMSNWRDVESVLVPGDQLHLIRVLRCTSISQVSETNKISYTTYEGVKPWRGTVAAAFFRRVVVLTAQ